MEREKIKLDPQLLDNHFSVYVKNLLFGDIEVKHWIEKDRYIHLNSGFQKNIDIKEIFNKDISYFKKKNKTLLKKDRINVNKIKMLHLYLGSELIHTVYTYKDDNKNIITIPGKSYQYFTVDKYLKIYPKQ